MKFKDHSEWLPFLALSFSLLKSRWGPQTQFGDTCYPSQATTMEVPHQAPDMCSKAYPYDVDRCPWDSQGLQGDKNTNLCLCSRKVKYPVPAHTAAL